MLVSFVAGLLLFASCAESLPIVQNLRSKAHQESNSVVIEWQLQQPIDNVVFTVRHKMRSDIPWNYVRTAGTQVRLALPEKTRTGDQLLVQVQAERGGHIIEAYGQELIITITKKVAIGDVLVDEGELLPPLDFTAHVLSPTRVQVQWRPSEGQTGEEIYYILSIQQLTSESGTALVRKQIKTPVTGFTMGKLIPGERYEMTIRSASKKTNRISSTAAIVEINLPASEDYVEIGNLIVSSYFNGRGPGNVNLSWEVPPQLRNKVVAYDVQYAEDGSNNWRNVQFRGATPSAVLHNLKSNTEYMLKINTVLANNVMTQSGVFKFKTPDVEQNPIQKVDVIYSHDVNSVKIHWILEPFVQVGEVAGYDVFLSEDLNRPENEWRLIRLNSGEASLALDNLKSSTTYFVKVNVRNRNGSVLRAPSVYRFKTVERVPDAGLKNDGNSLAYRNIGPGAVKITWTYPDEILDRVTGSTILYTERKDISPEQWSRVVINDSHNTSVVLQNLRQGTRYSVQIIPMLYTGENEYSAREQFEMKTDAAQGSPTATARGGSWGGEAPLPEGRFEQMRISELEYMRIVSCNPDAITTGCSWNELCISRVEDSKKGWCISNTLRDSILNS